MQIDKVFEGLKWHVYLQSVSYISQNTSNWKKSQHCHNVLVIANNNSAVMQTTSSDNIDVTSGEQNFCLFIHMKMKVKERITTNS